MNCSIHTLREMSKMHPKLIVLVGVVLLMSAAGCATSAPLPPSVSPSATSANLTPSSTAIARTSTPASPAPTSTAAEPWNPAGVRSVTDLAPADAPPAPANLLGCDGAEFRLLPHSARTTSTNGGYLTTTFVLQFTGSAPCSMSSELPGVNMTAADGTILPIDSLPAGPGSSLMRIGPHQLVFGSIWWAPKQGRPHPAHLTFTLRDHPPAPISIPVADVSIPPHPTNRSPQNAWQSTAYGRLTFAADPATLATLTATVMAPATVHVPSTLLYAVTLTNPTNTTVPLTGCPQFGEQLSVVPLKTPTTVGARGPLNCSHLPRAITANSSVTMQMQLDTAGQVAGPGRLTWQLLDRGHEATAGTTFVTVQRN